MKTAVSIPDAIFERAERVAKKLGVSRSELFTRALERFVESHRASEIRASYDRAFGAESGPDEMSELAASSAKRALREVEW